MAPLRILGVWSTTRRRSVEAAHAGGRRLGPEELVELLEVDEEAVEPRPRRIVVVDDVVTTGAHFVAARRILVGRFEGVGVVGVCLARRVFPDDERCS